MSTATNEQKVGYIHYLLTKISVYNEAARKHNEEIKNELR